MRRIYLASSWRNPRYLGVLAALRAGGHDVYDFRNPEPGNDGFHWTDIDVAWQSWTPAEYVALVTSHQAAQRGFDFDKRALDWADLCVLLLPCGRSAHLEAGYMIGQGKPTIFYIRPEDFEPELMYLLGSGFCFDDQSMIDAIVRLGGGDMS